MKKIAISIKKLNKTYNNGFTALRDINMDVKDGEIFALLGPNGAGKTTLIGTVCGLIRPTSGEIEVFGEDIIQQYREARSYIGLVPQELTTDLFETVWDTVSFSRALFGKPTNNALIESILKRLSLLDKRKEQIRHLSGGMKRRVMIAKALSHEPKVLFLDEPSAGVDVELRKSMWEEVRGLRKTGVTIILTTHYIKEAEEMADRVGVINKGKLIVVDEKDSLMKKMGLKCVQFTLGSPINSIPKALSKYELALSDDKQSINFTYKPFEQKNDISNLLDKLKENNIRPVDISVHQSSLEEIFIELINNKEKAA